MVYLNEEEKDGKEFEETALSYLSDNLREKIIKEINGRVLLENTIFNTHFGGKFL